MSKPRRCGHGHLVRRVTVSLDPEMVEALDACVVRRMQSGQWTNRSLMAEEMFRTAMGLKPRERKRRLL